MKVNLLKTILPQKISEPYRYSNISNQEIKYSGIILKRINFQNISFPKLSKNFSLNIFKQLWSSEIKHSLILYSLLNINGKYGCGDLFLRLFFETVIQDENIEYSKKEDWTVTVEKGRYDVKIQNSNATKIIIIENKSNYAEDKQNQLYRYWLNSIYKSQSNCRKIGLACFSKILYLSPSQYKTYTDQGVTRPDKTDKKYPEKVPEDIIKTIFYN